MIEARGVKALLREREKFLKPILKAVDYDNMRIGETRCVHEVSTGVFERDLGSILHASANAIGVTKNYSGPAISVGATAEVFNVDVGHDINGSIMGAKAQASVGDYHAIAEAGVHLVDAQMGAFHVKGGLGVDTGGGFVDDSFTAEVLGCGVTLGRKVEISFLGCGVGIDFGRLF